MSNIWTYCAKCMIRTMHNHMTKNVYTCEYCGKVFYKPVASDQNRMEIDGLHDKKVIAHGYSEQN